MVEWLLYGLYGLHCLVILCVLTWEFIVWLIEYDEGRHDSR